MSRLDIADRLRLLARGDNLDLADIVCGDAAARIEALEAALQQISLSLDGTDEWTDQETMVAYVVNRVKDAAARIEELEAALQFIADGYDNQDINHVDYRVRVYQIARAALDKDAGK